jgi:hypothetical protein
MNENQIQLYEQIQQAPSDSPDTIFSLYERIQEYPLDDSDAIFPFSQKLAKENNWTAEYTERAIEEYKKFLFLSVIAEHPVSPSEKVDRVWHLHLTYTKDYWEKFCPKVLGKFLHHQPSGGGNIERDKYFDWYQKTLDSYQLYFGEPASIEFWETPENRFLVEDSLVKVDRRSTLTKPKLDLFSFIIRAIRKQWGFILFFGITCPALFIDSSLHQSLADTTIGNSQNNSFVPLSSNTIVTIISIVGVVSVLMSFLSQETNNSRQKNNRRNSGDSSSSGSICTSGDCDGGSSGGDCGCGSSCGSGCGGGCGGGCGS